MERLVNTCTLGTQIISHLFCPFRTFSSEARGRKLCLGRGKLLMSINDEIKLMRKLSDAFNKNDRSKDVNIVNEM